MVCDGLPYNRKPKNIQILVTAEKNICKNRQNYANFN